MMKVKDMPAEVIEALNGRGIPEDQDMTPEDAIAEWTAWHLGDRYWGYEALRLYKAMAK